jgi:ubiquinone/menaquinone biosynthesis C-methylase UbiE
MGTKAKAAAAAALALAVGAAWERMRPSACPYAQRWLLDVPRPWLTPDRLAEILEPRAGERLLEVGPGTGVYALPMAERVGPKGTVAGLDLQQKMLDNLDLRAARAGTTNLELRQGDATALPYEDASFDGAFLVTVLGEVPDRNAALRELRRVLRPGGRVVFGETALDPHLVTLGRLKREAQAAGLRYDRQLGVAPLGFYARFSAD